MILHSLILDDFLFDCEAFRDYAIKQAYDGVKNPADGVVYPDVTIAIPDSIKEEIQDKLEYVLGKKINPSVFFMRLSKAGVHVPHQAHTDVVMAQYTFLLYLNKNEDCQGGTEIVQHANGLLKIQPETAEDVELWKQDTNTPDKWKVVGNCPMQFNRALVLRSDLFHRAQPIGGFGDTTENGRLVLTLFFGFANV